MRYKASLDGLAKMITSAAIILLVTLVWLSIRRLSASHSDSLKVVLIHSGIIFLSIVTLLGCYAFAPRYYDLKHDSLIIVRGLGTTEIKLKDIDHAQLMDSPKVSGFLVRTFGVGGLFGYYGKYYNSELGTVTLYTTQRRNRILISTVKGSKFVISPDNLEILQYLLK